MLGFIFKGLKDKTEDSSFWEHLDVLRKYIIRSIAIVFIFSTVAFFYKEFMFDDVILAPANPHFPTYRLLCYLGQRFSIDGLCISSIPLNLSNIELGGQFRYHIIISFVAGIIIAFPIIAWQLWLFIKPALESKEKKKVRGMVFYISTLFFSGVLFGYYVITPLTVNFLASYQLSPLIENRITISSYISNVTTLTFLMGLVFELPVLVYFLAKIGIITAAFLSKNRKWVIVIVFIIAGFITPSTDMFTQTIVALPLYALFELSLFITKRTSV